MKKRNEVTKEDSWQVEAMFKDIHEWNTAFRDAIPVEKPPHWPDLQRFRGHLKEGPKIIKEALDTLHALHRKLAFLYTWAHLKHDEDTRENDPKVALARIQVALSQFQNESSFFEPELLTLDPAPLIQAPELQEYRHHLERTFRLKEHTLSTNEEALLAIAQQPLAAARRAFSAINDSDFTFPSPVDSNGESHSLTHGQFSLFLNSSDRTLRENAFKLYHTEYGKYQNTLTELLGGNVETNQFHAKARRYSSALESALKPNNIPLAVYQNLITTVNSRLPSLHRYLQLRKKRLKLDKLQLWDLKVPLFPAANLKFTAKEAVDLVIESVAPLGSEYQTILARGLTKERWVDFFENESKRSGGYSSGCHDSNPYILLNFNGLLRDVYTLAHEAGHSMHSYYSRKNQPYQYSDYVIFVAEVASTFNEDLLTKTLLKHYPEKEVQMYLMNEKIEDIRGTLFRQTLFAEFELQIHTWVEEQIPLTPTLLAEKYGSLMRTHFGEHLHLDPVGLHEWSRIPHFYYNFYVYQYATGISAALALSEKLTNEGEPARARFIEFLKSGSSDYPIELLKRAGIDMTRPEPIHAAIDKFDKLVGELEKLSN